MSRAQQYVANLVASNPVAPALPEAFAYYQDIFQGAKRLIRHSMDDDSRVKTESTPTLLPPTAGMNARATSVPVEPNEAVVFIEFRSVQDD